jgi:hypothetical protein
MNVYRYGNNMPSMRVDPTGLQDFPFANSPALQAQVSLATHMANQGKSAEEISRALSPPPPRPIMTGECRGSLMAAVGTGFSVTVKANEVSGLSGEGAVPMIAAGARATASCGFKFADPDAKSLPAAAGVGFSVGVVSFDISQTSTWPEVYIGVGPGVGPEIKTPVAPAVAMPLF